MATGALTLARWGLAGSVAFHTFFVGSAWGHDEYPWVRNPQYITAFGVHCCEETHCQPAAPGELTPTPTGWRHNPTGTEITADKPGIYQTEDKAGRMFRCVMGGKLVCVFEGSGT